MILEDSELLDESFPSRVASSSAHPGARREVAYDPAYEWPGDIDIVSPSYHQTKKQALTPYGIYNSQVNDAPISARTYFDEYGVTSRHTISVPSSQTSSRPASPVVPDAFHAETLSLDPTSPERDNKQDHAALRLVLESSNVLPAKQRLAILDGYTEVQIGRDHAPAGTDTPRIRLKDMEVSKLHATLFWDKDRQRWAAVDMGSKHGTYVQSSSNEAHVPFPREPDFGDMKGQRLSASRTASVPRVLKHLDRLTVGCTTFIVHVHDERLPCIDCSASADPNAGDEIPLFLTDKKRKRDSPTAEITVPPSNPAIIDAPRDAKRALTSLRKDLLSKRTYSPSFPTTKLLASQTPIQTQTSSQTRYIDRSAKRRALHATSSALDAPGTSLASQSSNSASLGHASLLSPAQWQPAPGRTLPAESWSPPPSPAPPAPLGASNIGHKLLMKQGWQPGTALGTFDSAPEVTRTPEQSDAAPDDTVPERTALIAPLELSANLSRAGLGMQPQLTSSMAGDKPVVSRRQETNNWARRRWQDIRDRGS